MHTQDLAKGMVQVTGWKPENQPIPEHDLTKIIKSALNMQTGQYAGFTHKSGIQHIAKPYKLWIPHREGELENVLSLAGIHSLPQCQNQVFQNVKNVIVYMVHEPEYLMQTNSQLNNNNANDKDYISWLCAISDPEMEVRIREEWNSYSSFMDRFLEAEKNKRSNKAYDDPVESIVPYHKFSGEHLHLIYQTLGMAIGAASIQARELGYYVQFHTAYRGSVAWRDFYGNKFHPEGKWYPQVIQIIGTHPEQAKSSPFRTLVSEAVEDTSALVNPNDLDSLTAGIVEKKIKKPEYAYDFDVFDPQQYKEQIKPTLVTNAVPEYQKTFFEKNYGQYSKDPRRLYEQCYQGKANIA